MKLDNDLIRTILLKMEDGTLMNPETHDYDLPGVSEDDMEYHFYLLVDAGYITATEFAALSGTTYQPKAITWDGQAFLANIKNDTVWNKTKASVMDKAGTASLAIMQEAAKALVRASLGLP